MNKSQLRALTRLVISKRDEPGKEIKFSAKYLCSWNFSTGMHRDRKDAVTALASKLRNEAIKMIEFAAAIEAAMEGEAI